VAECETDLAEHQAHFRGKGLLSRLAQVGMKRMKERLLTRLDGLVELPELGQTEVPGSCNAGLEVGTLASDERGEIHVLFGELMTLEYKLVKFMICRVTVGLLLIGSLARADESDAAPTAAGIQEFIAASAAWDASGFAQAAERFAQACEKAPKVGTYYYWRGVAEFHRLLHLFGSPPPENPAEVAKAIRETIRTLTKALELDESDAESHALLANVYGLSIAAHPLRAAWLGPRVLKHQKMALRYGPRNPRVRYLIGTSQYHGPEALGGKRQALQHFLRAEELYADEAGQPPGPLEPRWGRSSCLAFIGKTYDALGKPGDAEDYYEQALEVNPRDPLARKELQKRKP